MFLSDVDIREYINEGIIEIDPPVIEKNYKQYGIRLHLSPIIYEFRKSEDVIDIRKDIYVDKKILLEKFYKEINMQDYENSGKPYVLEPGKMVLGMTVEKVKMPNYMVGFLDGRSTISRLGITNNITASFIDSVDNNDPKKIVLALSNCGNIRFVLYPKLPIGMLLFSILSNRTEIESSEQYSSDEDPLPNFAFPLENNIL